MRQEVRLMENLKINDKILQRLENSDEDVQEIIKKGLGYTEKAQISKVKSRIARDIEKLAKEKRK